MRAEGAEGSLRGVFSSAMPPQRFGDWLLLPSDSWLSLSTRPISGEKKKKAACPVSYPQRGLSGTDLFNCKETLSSTPGTPEQGRNCTYPPFFFFPYSFSPRYRFSAQDKLFSPCLIQQKAWKCSALSLCLALKGKEDDEMAGEGERDRDEEEQSEERGGRRGLLVIELRFCC